MMKKSKDRVRYYAAGCSIALIGIDQLLKLWAYHILQPIGRVRVIPRLFYLTYVENRGAAFGILQGRAGLLALFTGILLAALMILMLLGKFQGKLLNGTIALVLAGGFGNLIDRVFRGFVVDFLDFSALFGFPVFNFADCCVVVGAILLLCCSLFTDAFSDKKQPTGEKRAKRS